MTKKVFLSSEAFMSSEAFSSSKTDSGGPLMSEATDVFTATPGVTISLRDETICNDMTYTCFSLVIF